MHECTPSMGSAMFYLVGQLCNTEGVQNKPRPNLCVLLSRHDPSIRDVLISPSLLQPV